MRRKLSPLSLFPCIYLVILIWLLSVFSSPLVFSSLIIMCLFVFVVHCIYPSWVSFSFLDRQVDVFHYIWENFNHYSFQKLFLSHSLSDLLGDLNKTYVRLLNVVPQVLTLFMFYKLMFLSFFFRVKNFMNLFLVHCLSLITLNLLVSQSSKFLITGIFFSVIEFPFFSF